MIIPPSKLFCSPEHLTSPPPSKYLFDLSIDSLAFYFS
ncbi:hypothetical protein BGS_0612 [Beggiatoa sp. SS]|nr:hypothetical protein BGS_0612 [Beggiatoa sp. SS]